LEGIELSKQNSMEKLVFGLGIRLVGAKAAKTLSQTFLHLDRLMNASVDELVAIDEIGPKMADSIAAYFQSHEVRKTIERLKNAGVNLQYNGRRLEDISGDSPFAGKTVVL